MSLDLGRADLPVLSTGRVEDFHRFGFIGIAGDLGA